MRPSSRSTCGDRFGDGVVVGDVDRDGRGGVAELGLGRAQQVGVHVPEADLGARGDEPRAMAKPMPCAPPVMTATWSLRSMAFKARVSGQVRAAVGDAPRAVWERRLEGGGDIGARARPGASR